MGWGGGESVKNAKKKKTTPFWGSKITNLLVFSDSESKRHFLIPTPWGLVRLISAVKEAFSLFFVAMTASFGVGSGDVMTVYPRQDVNRHILQPLAPPRVGHGLYESREIAVSMENGLDELAEKLTFCGDP